MSQKHKIFTEELKSIAKKKYMDYEPISRIAIELGLNKSTVQYQVNNHWKAEREMNKAELFSTMHDTKKVDFMKMTQATIKIMTRALGHLADRDKPPTMLESKQASEILSTLDKITRLDDGNPTDIISNQEKPLTIEMVRKKIAVDPFAEEEYKEIESHEEDN